MWTIAMLCVGALIGWQVPQPAFVKRWTDAGWAWVKQSIASIGNRW